MLTGRNKERGVLEEQYSRPGASLFVLYGRRRVGKTALLLDFCRDIPHFFYLASEEGIRSNRADIQAAAWKACGDVLFAPDSAPGWETILDSIAAWGQERKMVVVLDEFQNLGLADPAFPARLRRIWDSTLSRRNVLLILCGSRIPQMTAQVLSADSPLRESVTGWLRLEPLPFSAFTGFFPPERRTDLPGMAEVYAVTGGIPMYGKMFAGDGGSLRDRISFRILNPDSMLYVEPLLLLTKEMRETGTYCSILRAIAGGHRKLSSLSGAVERKSTSLTGPLSALMACGLVEREVPVTVAVPSASKMGRYRIREPFFTFWFRYVWPHRNDLAAGQREAVLDAIREDFSARYAPMVFEDICREFLMDWLRAGNLPGLDRVGRWWREDGKEIGITALGDRSGRILFGACQFRSGRSMGQGALYELMTRAKDVPWGSPEREEYWALFSVSGFTPDLVARTEDMPGLLLFDMRSWPGKRVLP